MGGKKSRRKKGRPESALLRSPGGTGGHIINKYLVEIMKTDPQIFAQAAEFVKCFKRGARVRVPPMVFRLWPQFMRTVHQLMEENDQ